MFWKKTHSSKAKATQDTHVVEQTNKHKPFNLQLILSFLRGSIRRKFSGSIYVIWVCIYRRGTLKNPATICLISLKITIVDDLAVLCDTELRNLGLVIFCTRMYYECFLRSWMWFHVYSCCLKIPEQLQLFQFKLSYGLHTTSINKAYIHHPRSMASLTSNHTLTKESPPMGLVTGNRLERFKDIRRG